MAALCKDITRGYCLHHSRCIKLYESFVPILTSPDKNKLLSLKFVLCHFILQALKSQGVLRLLTRFFQYRYKRYVNTASMRIGIFNISGVYQAVVYRIKITPEYRVSFIFYDLRYFDIDFLLLHLMFSRFYAFCA